jgi:predicted amidohydrolase
MKVLIGQPKHESGVEQMKNEIKMNKGLDFALYPEGYLSNEIALEEACQIAKQYNIAIITSYRKENKDRAVIISNSGEIVLERAKTPPDEEKELYQPLVIDYNNMTIGYLLCMEILKGFRDLKSVNGKISFIVHPIGVGMFSDEQFEEWIKEAKNIAKTYKTIIIGASHADGSFRNCGISIPISYCIDSDGEPVFISKSDTRTRIVNLNTKDIEFAVN